MNDLLTPLDGRERKIILKRFGLDGGRPKTLEEVGKATRPKYNARNAAYDLRKLRGKAWARRIDNSRRYRVRRPGIRCLAALLILREKLSNPVLARLCLGRDPQKLLRSSG